VLGEPPHSVSGTRAETWIAIRSPGEPEEFPTPTRRFTLWETTSGLPDDSREEDERGEERQLRDPRGRVKAARAIVSATPGLAEAIRADWTRAAVLYAPFGTTETIFRCGVRNGSPTEAD
jgi:hypothetical protein